MSKRAKSVLMMVFCKREKGEGENVSHTDAINEKSRDCGSRRFSTRFNARLSVLSGAQLGALRAPVHQYFTVQP